MSEGRKKLRLRQAKKNQKAKECRRKWAAFTIKMEMDIARVMQDMHSTHSPRTIFKFSDT